MFILTEIMDSHILDYVLRVADALTVTRAVTILLLLV